MPPLLVVEYDEEGTYCSICGDVGLESHYHCLECGDTCSMMGCGKPVCTERAKRRATLEERERELFALDDSQGWSGFLLNGVERNVIDRMEEEPIWRRGFIETMHAGTNDCDLPRLFQVRESHPVTVLTMTAESWLLHAERLIAKCPVREVTLTTPITPEYYALINPDNITDNIDSAILRRWPGIRFNFTIGASWDATPLTDAFPPGRVRLERATVDESGEHVSITYNFTVPPEPPTPPPT